MSLRAALRSARNLAADARLVADAHARRGSRRPALAALADPSVWALTLLRTSAALRSTVGTSCGLSTVLRVAFHIDIWTDDIGPGLRLPHPFCIVIGEGTRLGADCTLMHNVTIQRGQSTIGDGVTLTTGVTVLAGSHVGDHALIGAHSVVRGPIPPGAVAVGAPARITHQPSKEARHTPPQPHP